MADGVLLARRDVGGGLLLVTIDVAASEAGGYVAPGQYVAVEAGEGEGGGAPGTGTQRGYFALAGAVGKRPWELLVRNAGDAAALLVGRDLGTPVALSAPLGEGFPLSATRGRPLVVAVVASALGVARALMEARIAEGEAATTSIYVGVRSASDVPLPAEVDGWASAGARVVLCLSRSELEHHASLLPRARRAAGWVQRALANDIDVARPDPATLVVAAGPGAMLADLRGVADAGSIELLTNVAS